MDTNKTLSPEESEADQAEQLTQQPAEQLPERKKPAITRKLMVLIGLISIVLISPILLIVFNRPEGSNNAQAINESSQNSNELATITDEIRDFKACEEAGYEVKEDDGEKYCTTPDGMTYFVDDEKLDSQDDESERTSSIAVDGERKLEVFIGARTLHDVEVGDSMTSFKIRSGTTRQLPVYVNATGVDLDKCELKVLTLPDKPDIASSEKTLKALTTQSLDFIDGKHTATVECRDRRSALSAQHTVRVWDNLPEKCQSVSYNVPHTASVTTLAEFQSQIVGTWVGCADSPWWPTYYVEITFNADGSYSAASGEELDGNISHGGFYDYNLEGAHNSKVYGLTSFQNGTGQGFIDMVHPNGSTIQRGDLRNAKVSGDKLVFDFYHRSQYGPIVFQLNKKK